VWAYTAPPSSLLFALCSSSALISSRMPPI
jgi:hypothetical protein